MSENVDNQSESRKTASFVHLGVSGTDFRTLDFVRGGDAITNWRAKSTEFTCRCPVTNQPDYATISVEIFVSKEGANWRHFIETKSLKLYLETFRERRIFHEAVVSEICLFVAQGLQEVASGSDDTPNQDVHVRVEGEFHSRGGISVVVAAGRTLHVAEYGRVHLLPSTAEVE